MFYAIEKLGNGVTLLKVPMPDSMSVVVNFFVKTGSRNEEPSKRGMSHFLEHLLFKGFDIREGFIVGYGTDCGEMGRNLPGVYVLE